MTQMEAMTAACGFLFSHFPFAFLSTEAQQKPNSTQLATIAHMQKWLCIPLEDDHTDNESVDISSEPKAYY